MRKHFIATIVAALATVGLAAPASATDFSTPGWWDIPSYTGPGAEEDKWTYPDYPIRCNTDPSAAAWQFIWVHDQAKADRIETVRPGLREVVKRGLSVFSASAQDTFNAAKNGSNAIIAQAPRVVTYSTSDPNVCHPTFYNEAVPASVMRDTNGPDSLWSLLRSRGYDVENRKYMALVDTDPVAGVRGWSATGGDSRLVYGNANNTTSHSLVYSRNWAGDDEAVSALPHEMAHAMGAVANDAPNNNGTAHTHKQKDLMAYKTIEPGDFVGCTGDKNWVRADCGETDYFMRKATLNNGRASGYLATHWSVNDSRFMYGAHASKPKPSTGTLQLKRDARTEIIVK